MLKVFSTFSGIGGFEIGIEKALGGEVEFVGYSEIDKYACSVYERHFKEVKNYGDITEIDAESLPDFDCLAGGFPCQAFSVAGRGAGFDDTRGTLFFDLARILRAKQPRLFVFENVKGLLSHDGGKTFRIIIATIDELGYDCQWQVLNSKDFGVPQNRERIIIVGHLRGEPRPQVFPIRSGDSNYIREVTKSVPQAQRVYDQSGISPTLDTATGGNRQPKIITGSPEYIAGKRSMKYRLSDIAPTIRATQHKSGDNQPKVVSFNRKKGIVKELEISRPMQAGDHRGLNRNQDQNAVIYPVITPDRANKSQNGRRIKQAGDPAFTVTATDRHGIYDGAKIRRLTPIECERLQGFPDDWTAEGVMLCRGKLCNAGKYDGCLGHFVEISDSQRYKMCGNAVTTNVVQAVFERLALEGLK